MRLKALPGSQTGAQQSANNALSPKYQRPDHTAPYRSALPSPVNHTEQWLMKIILKGWKTPPTDLSNIKVSHHMDSLPSTDLIDCPTKG